jgi:hypothetical protein
MPLSLGILTIVSVSVFKNTINHGTDWKCEAYLHVFTAYRLKIGRNIRMQKHFSYIYLKTERFSWFYMEPSGYIYIKQDIQWIIAKTWQ